MKNILRNILSILLILSMAFLTGCGESHVGTEDPETFSEEEYPEAIAYAEGEVVDAAPVERVPIRLAGLKGPTSMGLVRLLEESAEENPVEVEIISADGSTDSTSIRPFTCEFTLAGSADEITPKMLKGDLDIAAVPINLASVLYNKSQGTIRMIAINTLGVNYIVENPADGQSAAIESLADLKGRTVYATGKGSTPEYILTYLLKQCGLDISKDVDVQWKSEPAEVVALMASKPGSVAMLPQPYVTVAEGQVANLRVAVDLTAVWDALGKDSRLITSALVVRSEFADEHPDTVEAFLRACEDSVNYVNTNVAEAAQLIEKYDIVKAVVAEKAIPQCNIVCITGAAMQLAAEEYLNILCGLNADAVGGYLPSRDFYYIGQ